MPVTRSAFARATRSSRSGGSSRSARYVTATYDRSSSASVSNAWIATEADVERYPKFDDLLEKWKGAIDTLHRLKGSDKLASLKNIEFDDEMSTIDRIQMACGRLGIDESVFDLHICITDDGKKICFCFACCYEGAGVQPRSYSLQNKAKNMERHPSSDGHCRVIAKLLGLDWKILAKKLECPHCAFAVNACRLDQFTKHMRKAHSDIDDTQETSNARLHPTVSPSSDTESLSSLLSLSPLFSASTVSLPTPLPLDGSSYSSNDECDFFKPQVITDNYGGQYALTQPLDSLSYSQLTYGTDDFGSSSCYAANYHYHVPSLYPPADHLMYQSEAEVGVSQSSSVGSPYEKFEDWEYLPTDVYTQTQWSSSSPIPDLDGTMPGALPSQTLQLPVTFQPSLDLAYNSQLFGGEIAVFA